MMKESIDESMDMGMIRLYQDMRTSQLENISTQQLQMRKW